MFQKQNKRSPEPEALAEERARMRQLRTLVDLTAAILYQSDCSVSEAFELIASCRRSVLHLFPESGQTFDLIYKPRFERIVAERFDGSGSKYGAAD
jgi:hypothetical protein